MVIPSLLLGVVGMGVIALLTYFFSVYFFRSVNYDDMVAELKQKESNDRGAVTSNNSKQLQKKERQKAKKAELKAAAAAALAVDEAAAAAALALDEAAAKETKKEAMVLAEQATSKKIKKKRFAEPAVQPTKESVDVAAKLNGGTINDVESHARRNKKKQSNRFKEEAAAEEEMEEVIVAVSSSQVQGAPVINAAGKRRPRAGDQSLASMVSAPQVLEAVVQKAPAVASFEDVLRAVTNTDGMSPMERGRLLQALRAVPIGDAEELRQEVRDRDGQLGDLRRNVEKLNKTLSDESVRSKSAQQMAQQLQAQGQSQANALKIALESAQKDQERLRQFENQYAIVNEELQKRVSQCDRADRERKGLEQKLQQLKSRPVVNAADQAKEELAMEAETRQRRALEEQLQNQRSQLLQREKELGEARSELEMQRRGAQGPPRGARRNNEDMIAGEMRRLEAELAAEKRCAGEAARQHEEQRAAHAAERQREAQEKEALVARLHETAQRVDQVCAQFDELKGENQKLRLAATTAASAAATAVVDTKAAEDLAAAQAELATYKAKNNELRTKNWEVIEELNKSKAAAAAAPLASAALEAEQAECQRAWKEASRFQACLNETDATLQRLQRCVDEEQLTWAASLKEAEAENRLARTEVQRLLTEEARLAAAAEEARAALATERQSGQAAGAAAEAARAQVQALEAELAAARSTPAPATNGTGELEQLRAALAEERQSREELNKTNARLTKLVDIGQDALKQEQTLVVKLQAQKPPKKASKTKTTS